MLYVNDIGDVKKKKKKQTLESGKPGVRKTTSWVNLSKLLDF